MRGRFTKRQFSWSTSSCGERTTYVARSWLAERGIAGKSRGKTRVGGTDQHPLVDRRVGSQIVAASSPVSLCCMKMEHVVHFHTILWPDRGGVFWWVSRIFRALVAIFSGFNSAPRSLAVVAIAALRFMLPRASLLRPLYNDQLGAIPDLDTRQVSRGLIKCAASWDAML